jgi:hypothetical protein
LPARLHALTIHGVIGASAPITPFVFAHSPLEKKRQRRKQCERE